MRHTMRHTRHALPPPVSPLLLSDQLLTLAEQAGQAGYQEAARRLLTLARRMLSQPPLVQPVSVPVKPRGPAKLREAAPPASATRRRDR